MLLIIFVLFLEKNAKFTFLKLYLFFGHTQFLLQKLNSSIVQKYIGLHVWIFVFCFQTGPSQLVCYTIGGPGANNPCVFPFRYNGVFYNECTLVAADDNKPWCSTRVYDNGTHVSGGGHYGNCGPRCPLPGRSFIKCGSNWPNVSLVRVNWEKKTFRILVLVLN